MEVVWVEERLGREGGSAPSHILDQPAFSCPAEQTPPIQLPQAWPIPMLQPVHMSAHWGWMD